jgi:ribosomal protein S18 acetylase RimI-like enzyme
METRAGRPSDLGHRFAKLLRRVSMNGRVVIIVYRNQASVTLPSPLEIRRVDLDNLVDALSMEPPERVEEFRGFLERGDLGYYAYREGTVVHRAWVRLGPLTVPTYFGFVPIRIPVGDAFIHYCETAPSARGTGVYPAVLAHITSELRARGIREITISTTLDNQASRRGIEKAGFEEMRRFDLILVLGMPIQREAHHPAFGVPKHG